MAQLVRKNETVRSRGLGNAHDIQTIDWMNCMKDGRYEASLQPSSYREALTEINSQKKKQKNGYL